MSLVRDDPTTFEAVTGNAPTPAPMSAAPSPCLIVASSSRPEAIGRVYRLGPGEALIGRGEDVRIQVDDPGISRRHAKVTRTPEGSCAVEDLGSTNGTYLNGRRVRSAELSEGDRIQMGTVTVLRFSMRELVEESEVRLRQALAAAGVGTWEWDAKTGRIALVAGADWLLRYAGSDVWPAVHPEDRPRLQQALEQAASSGGPCDLEVRLGAEQGHRWVAMRGIVLRSEGGQPLGVAGVLVDVSSGKRTEQELRRQALLFESLSDAVIVTDLGGSVLDWNAAATRMLGYGKAEALGRTPGALLQPEDPGILTRLIVEGIACEGRWQGERKLRRKDGSPCDADIHAMPLRSADGRHIANVAVCRDVGEERRMRARLELADRVGSLGTLAAGMAHEINNPLAYVIANLDYLRRAFADLSGGASPTELAEAQAVLAEAREGAERIRIIVGDLRTFNGGASPDERASANVEAVVDFAVRIASNEIRHHARLVKELDEVPPVRMTESRLAQVVINLLVNGAQAIADGKAAQNQIRVSASCGPRRETVKIQVSDTGCGISSENLARIFDPFFTTKEIGVGTGLGLFVCHNLVEAAGGEITVESKVGGGTTFTVVLPAADPPSAEEHPRPPPPQDVRRARVLVVDDEQRMAAAIRRHLAARHEVTAVHQAAEALRIVQAGERFDVILCDLMMPDITGMDLQERLTTLAPDQARRTIFMTGGAFTRRSQEFLIATPNPRLQKPLSMDELDATIERVLAAP